VVLSEPSVEDGHWEDLLNELRKMTNPPPLIVAFRLADERFWAEVLNRGGYDVLLKPLETREVLRIVDQAWQQWKSKLELQAVAS
jgi:DNA-binding response OmpR family regulator